MSELTHLKGPEFVAWLEKNGLSQPHPQLGPTLARRVHAWRNGSVAGLDAADRVLIALDIPMPDVPDDLWCADPVRGARPEQRHPRREEAERLLREGWLVTEVAHQVCVPVKTVSRWRQEMEDDLEAAA